MADLTIPNDKLRLFLTFLDELKQVKVLAATNRIGSQLCIMGGVEGREQLQDLLDKAGIDHYIFCAGEPFTPNFKVTAYEQSPRLIVESLEKWFRKADELQLKILQGEKLTDEEWSFTTPPYLHVCSGSVKTEEGLKRIEAWFNAKKGLANKASAAT